MDGRKQVVAYGDPSIVNKHNEATGTTAAEEMLKHSLILMAANNDRLARANKLRELLKIEKDPNT